MLVYMADMYSSIGLVMALYVASIVFFCFTHVVDMSALSIVLLLLLHCLYIFM